MTCGKSLSQFAIKGYSLSDTKQYRHEESHIQDVANTSVAIQEFKSFGSAYKKVKLSHYTPWRCLRGQEV
jgi:hypothetical protein